MIFDPYTELRKAPLRMYITPSDFDQFKQFLAYDKKVSFMIGSSVSQITCLAIGLNGTRIVMFAHMFCEAWAFPHWVYYVAFCHMICLGLFLKTFETLDGAV